MRALKLILIFTVFLGQVKAQNSDTIFIYKKSNTIEKYYISDIDSIVFYKITPKTISDIDGNIYNVIKIGDQYWTKENLRVTKYNDGNTIPLVEPAITWGNTTNAAYCWYENNIAENAVTYGALYNWRVIETGKLCPIGWHVPSINEWNKLIVFVGGENIAGGKLKEDGFEHWIEPNEGATNEYDFTGLPGGNRDVYGIYRYLKSYGFWWTSTNVGTAVAKNVNMHYDFTYVGSYNDDKVFGFSVRCVKD